MSKGENGLWSGLVGGAVFLLFYLVLPIGFWLALGTGAAAFGASFLFFSSGDKKPMNLAMEGITQEMVDQALAEGGEKLRELRAVATEVTHPGIKAHLVKINDLVARILEDIKQDPKHVKPARQFLSYYLDTTSKIMKQYQALAAKGSTSAEVKKVLDRVESMLGTIEDAFEKQLAKLLEDDVLNLDTELTVLERTIQMEGLGEDPLKKSQGSN